MNVIVKTDSIWLSEEPQFTVKDGIKLKVPKLESPTHTGIVTGDLIKGQTQYSLPQGITADDVADVEIVATTQQL